MVAEIRDVATGELSLGFLALMQGAYGAVLRDGLALKKNALGFAFDFAGVGDAFLAAQPVFLDDHQVLQFQQ